MTSIGRVQDESESYHEKTRVDNSVSKYRMNITATAADTSKDGFGLTRFVAASLRH